MELPYVTQDLPGTGGKLRKTPGHFIVEELPLYKPEGRGSHLYVSLTKEGLTSREVQEKLAGLFKLKPRDVGVAGLKDKRARATQTFSLPVGEDKEAVERIKSGLPVTVNWARLHTNKLRRGHLLGNRFTITITGLELSPDEALARAERIAVRLRETGLPNYFGPQRFGIEGDNARKGLELLQGKLRVSNAWLRRFLVSSYQSHLCNKYLALRVESGRFSRMLEGDIAKKYSTGGLFLVEDAREAQSRYEGHEISFTAPMFGSKMRQAAGPAGRLEAEVLAQAGLTLEQFGQAEGTRRLGRLLVPDLEVKPIPEGLAVAFSLPKGGFATTVLREIMKVL